MPPWRRPNAWLSRQLNGILRYDFQYKEIPLASAARKFREKHKVNLTVAEIEHCVRDSLRQGEPYFEYLAGDPATIAAALEPGWKRRYENHGDDDDDWEDYWGNWRQWGNSKEGGGSSGDGGTKTMQAKKEEQQVKKDEKDDGGTKTMQAKKEDQQVKKDEDELQVKNEDGAKREEPSSSPPNSPPHDEHATTAKNCPPCPAYDSWEAPPVAALRPPPPPPPRQRSWVISEPPPAKHPGPKVMWARPPPNTWARPPPSMIDLG